MRVRPILPAILGLAAGCGPWIITPETSTPSVSPSAPAFADERVLLAAQFDVDPQALVPTADGLVFVVEAGDELHLLLSRAGNTEEIEVLARVERFEIADNASGGSSNVVACPVGTLQVRYYLFGQDTRELTRVMVGLEALGGDVVEGLWVMAILDDEITLDQQWEIRDGLGIAPMESGTGAHFLADGTGGDGHTTLCESLH
ncbi:MAG: hypothetical protein M3406_15035 [Chloroflexota bacterium]|nr:hypothetical protein [Chloroflexota bacterium]